MNAHDARLLLVVLLRYVMVGVCLGALFFLTAGTMFFINAWMYIVVMLSVMGIGFAVLYRKDKSLLEKRMKTSESRKTQRVFVVVSGILLVFMYSLPGLDFRYHWSRVPNWLVAVSLVFSVIGYALNLLVMLQNSYASRVIEIQDKQKLIDTGLYSVVRHPMYAAVTLLYVFSPLALGSFVALIPGLLFPFALMVRIRNEEKLLAEELDGYTAYMKRVRYRLLPFVW